MSARPLLLLLLLGCGAPALGGSPRTPETPAPPGAAGRCGASAPPLTVRFYDAGQGLAALVSLPDGRQVMVDSGESPSRPGCGQVCRAWHERVLAGLERDLGGAPIDLLWLTHPHSDHIGGAAAILERFAVSTVVHNGHFEDSKTAQTLAAKVEARAVVVDPERRQLPFGQEPVNASGAERATLRAVVPKRWPGRCSANANNCSIGLRIDYCQSSLLFVGDAEHEEEALLDPGPVSLLQVSHHGSETSSSEGFLAATRPSFAVIAVGRPGEGTNRGYCLPRTSVVERLTRALGGPGRDSMLTYDGATGACKTSAPGDWQQTPTSDRLWSTARDGTVTLQTRGDGQFVRVP